MEEMAAERRGILLLSALTREASLALLGFALMLGLDTGLG